MNIMEKVKKFLRKYQLLLIILGLLAFTYGWFATKGIIPAGYDLEKSDWLAFWGGFLSFAGSLILGVVSIRQNKQANAVNERAIAENRHMNQVEFENELMRNKYTLIIDGIHQIYQRIYGIIQRADLNRNAKPTQDTLNFFDSLLLDIQLLYDIEIDSFLPSCYDEEFPTLVEGKKNIKEAVCATKKEIEKARKNLCKSMEESDFDQALASNPTHINLVFNIDSKAVLELNSYFQKKLNSISTYTPFDKEN